jgi:multidrug efflux pump subunit AcrA (membrane-fusion protein)
VKPLALVLAAGLLVAGCGGSDDPRVQTARVARADVTEVVDAPGTVTARATSTLTAAAAGTVAAVLVRDGQQVRKGDVLVRVSSPAAQERLRQALAAAAGADAAQVELPRPDLSPLLDAVDAAAAASFAAGRAAAAQVQDPGRRRQAEQQVAAAERQYGTASAAARAAVAQAGNGIGSVETAVNAVAATQRAQAAAAVTAARQTVDALTVRAPFAGTATLGGTAPAAAGGDLSGLVGRLPAAVQGQAEQALGGGAQPRTTTDQIAAGAQVASGAALVTVTDLGGLSVTAEVDETDVLLVKPGVRATIEVDAVPDATYPGLVTGVELAPTTSARGGVSYRVRVSLDPGTTGDDERAPAPRPGMSAVVDLQVRNAAAVLSVPAAAVVRVDGRDAVYVVEGGKVQARRVLVGAAGTDRVEVRRGVAEGDRIVVRDADRLRDGQSVRA